MTSAMNIQQAAKHLAEHFISEFPFWFYDTKDEAQKDADAVSAVTKRLFEVLESTKDSKPYFYVKEKE